MDFNFSGFLKNKFQPEILKSVKNIVLEKVLLKVQVFADKMDKILNSRTISKKVLPKSIEVLEI